MIPDSITCDLVKEHTFSLTQTENTSLYGNNVNMIIFYQLSSSQSTYISRFFSFLLLSKYFWKIFSVKIKYQERFCLIDIIDNQERLY